jgi:integrase
MTRRLSSADVQATCPGQINGRDWARKLFADEVARVTRARIEGAAAVATFADAVSAYLAPFTLPDGTITNSNAPYLDAMMPIMGSTNLCEIRQGDLDRMARQLYPNRSASSLRRHVYTPFIACWNAAAGADPPLCEYRRWKAIRVPKREPVDPATDEYIAKLRTGIAAGFNAVRNDAVVLFITLTGARSGEAQKVRMRDVRLDQGRVTITRDKRGKTRTVQMHPELLAAMHRLVLERRQEGAGDDDLLFRFSTRWGIPQMVARARARAGLPYHRPHEIGRHAFAARLLEHGATTFEVSQAGGWDKPRMVEEVYGHLARTHIDRIVSQVPFAGQSHRPSLQSHDTGQAGERLRGGSTENPTGD